MNLLEDLQKIYIKNEANAIVSRRIFINFHACHRRSMEPCFEVPMTDLNFCLPNEFLVMSILSVGGQT